MFSTHGFGWHQCLRFLVLVSWNSSRFIVSVACTVKSVLSPKVINRPALGFLSCTSASRPRVTLSDPKIPRQEQQCLTQELSCSAWL